MAKYYVESGVNLRTVVDAIYPIEAVKIALDRLQSLAGEYQLDLIAELDESITVNERGFIADRPNRRPYRDDIHLETARLLNALQDYQP